VCIDGAIHSVRVRMQERRPACTLPQRSMGISERRPSGCLMMSNIRRHLCTSRQGKIQKMLLKMYSSVPSVGSYDQTARQYRSHRFFPGFTRDEKVVPITTAR
jgi:hypothetical protein